MVVVMAHSIGSSGPSPFDVDADQSRGVVVVVIDGGGGILLLFMLCCCFN